MNAFILYYKSNAIGLNTICRMFHTYMTTIFRHMDRGKKKKNFTLCEKACGLRSYAIACPHKKNKRESRGKKSIWEESEIEEKHKR